METLSHITLSELQALFNDTNLSREIRLTVTIENGNNALTVAKRRKAIDAMKKLKGSGNGNLVNALLLDRMRDKNL